MEEEFFKDVSAGTRVPTVKADSRPPLIEPPQELGDGGEGVGCVAEMDRDLLGPICMQMIKDAFLTLCGLSFCYMCIMSDCPSAATSSPPISSSLTSCSISF